MLEPRWSSVTKEQKKVGFHSTTENQQVSSKVQRDVETQLITERYRSLIVMLHIYPVLTEIRIREGIIMDQKRPGY